MRWRVRFFNGAGFLASYLVLTVKMDYLRIVKDGFSLAAIHSFVLQ